MQGIYEIRNKRDGKVYIGSSVHIKVRFGQHKRALIAGIHHSKHLQSVFNKYGMEALEFRVIEQVADKKYLLQREQSYLDLWKPYLRKNGYNTARSATHARLGVAHTEEAKRKMSALKKGIPLSPEHKAKVVQALIGRPQSASCRRKISEKNRAFADSDIDEIVDLFTRGATQRSLAQKYSVSKTTVNALFKKLFAEKRLVKRSVTNTAKVLSLLSEGSITQAQIARITGLSKARVSTIKTTAQHDLCSLSAS